MPVPAVSILVGEIGSIEPYAINGFELMAIGPISGSLHLAGEATSGDCAFQDAELGSRE